MTPRTITVGSGRSVSVRGHGFFNGMTATVNDVPHAIGVVDSTTATLTIDDSLTTSARRLGIRVRNPAPTPTNFEMDTLDVRTTDIESVSIVPGPYQVIRGDTLRHRVYATIPAVVAGGPALHVIAGNGTGLITALPIPGEVRDIAVSSDAHYLYATVPSTQQVLRFDLNTLTLDRSWTPFAGPGDSLRPYYLAPSPTVPTTVAVFTGAGALNGFHHVAVYDDTLRRPHLADVNGSYVGTVRWASDSEIALLQHTGPSPWYIVHIDSLGTDSVRYVWTWDLQITDFLVYGDTLIGNEGGLAQFHTGTGIGYIPDRGSPFLIPIAAGPEGKVFVASRDGYPLVQYLRLFDVGSMTSIGPAVAFPALRFPARLEWLGGGYFAISSDGNGIEIVKVDRNDW